RVLRHPGRPDRPRHPAGTRRHPARTRLRGRPGRGARMSRLLRIEARRSPLPALFPLCLVLLYLTPIAQHLEPVALWTDRSTDLQSAVQMIGPFTAATAAWAGS